MNERIKVDPNIHFGKPVIAGTRITVQDVLELINQDLSFHDIRADYYPDLTTEDIKACVDYAISLISAEDIKDPNTGEVIVPADTYLVEDQVDLIEKAAVQSVKVRSVLTCEAKAGVCGACYGRDLARGTPVNIGEAVGVIAAQSIGEPAPS